MRIAVFSTRLSGTDGVSLETAKWARVLERMGHEVFSCAGALDPRDPRGHCIPEMHFRNADAMAEGARAFGSEDPGSEIADALARLSVPLKGALLQFVHEKKIELLVVENAHALPVQLFLGKALADLITETGLPTISHHHDFHWERPRYAQSQIPEFLDTYFPFDAPNVRHAVTHAGAQRDLQMRRDIDSVVIPNVLDFANEPPGIEDFNADFHQAINLPDERLLILQPTRVVPRKGIELAIELVSRLGAPAALVVTHDAGDDGLEYLKQLEVKAGQLGVDFRYVPELIGARRDLKPNGHKQYSLWDAYPHADLVTLPSLHEGFGNALVETMYYRRPAMVNRYPVYAEDIGPLGFDFVEIDGKITEDTITAVLDILDDPERELAAVEKNYALGKEHFSYEVLEDKLGQILAGI